MVQFSPLTILCLRETKLLFDPYWVWLIYTFNDLAYIKVSHALKYAQGLVTQPRCSKISVAVLRCADLCAVCSAAVCTAAAVPLLHQCCVAYRPLVCNYCATVALFIYFA